MKLLAIADLHLAVAVNREALRGIGAYPEDWLILAGDVCENQSLFAEALAFLAARFARVFWTPGNHELWLSGPADPTCSVAKYHSLVETARSLGVRTPEDEYEDFPPTGDLIAPILTLYDYSFRPADIPRSQVVAWAAERRNVAADERLIRTAPYPDIAAWCTDRVADTDARLAASRRPGQRSILAGHYPLRADLVHIPRVPRFTPWCGTSLTRDWHTRHNVKRAVSGHLHVRRTDWRDGTRFHEVSLGYATQWDQSRGIDAYLRNILAD